MEAERGGRLRRGLAAARGRRALAAVAATAALCAAGAVALLLGGSGGGAAAGTSAAGGATGTVERRTLAERLTATGTIDYAGETTVLARLSGTVTALPAIGDVIRRGGRLYAVDGEPVLLMYGAVPAYRALAAGVGEGEDVEQLERNLAALGYEPGTVDREFTDATAAALADWQEDVGLEATGELELGRVTFLRGPQRVTELEATLGEALSGGGGGGGGSKNSMVAWEPEAEEGIEAAREAEAKEEQPQPQPKAEEKPRREPEEAEPQPKKEPQPKEEPQPREEPGPSSVPVLRTSSTRRVVSVELEADQQSIAHRGQRVQVLLPGGAEVPGRVRGLVAVQSSRGEGGQGEETKPGVEATIAVIGKHRIPALDGATVNVRFTQRVRKQVLSVPLTALIAIGGGRFAVYVRGDGARGRIVVTPGLAADGYVEVEGRGLRVGMKVETGE